jgi:membrane-bound metal-dependent hydrolase YbcI (DUF457 family)
MGSSHALSGASGWLAGCAVLGSAGFHPSATAVFVGTAISAGSALLPDCDHPGSCLAYAFGPASRWLCRRIAHGCAALHARTRTPLDVRDLDGHRTLTHTVLWCLATGAIATVGGWRGDLPVAAFILFAATGLAVRALWPKRKRGTFGATIAGLLAGAVLVLAQPGGSWWWIGVPVTFGCLAHVAGDALTNSGVPALFPLMIGGRRWKRLGAPKAMRFGTGGRTERLVRWLFLIGALGAGWVLIA